MGGGGVGNIYLSRLFAVGVALYFCRVFDYLAAHLRFL